MNAARQSKYMRPAGLKYRQRFLHSGKAD